jgi:hypothetical protein
MTDLRDQMAMAALTGLLANRDSSPGMKSWVSDYVAQAYRYADAMLAERNRTTKGEDHV